MKDLLITETFYGNETEVIVKLLLQKYSLIAYETSCSLEDLITKEEIDYLVRHIPPNLYRRYKELVNTLSDL